MLRDALATLSKTLSFGMQGHLAGAQLFFSWSSIIFFFFQRIFFNSIQVDVYAMLYDKYCLTACRCFPIICVCIVYVMYFFPFPIATHLTCEAKTA